MKKAIPGLLVFIACNFHPVARSQPSLLIRDATDGPQTFAMVLGISKYKFVRPLTFADKDAELFRDYLRSPAGGSVKNENIYCLLNEQATNSNFWIKGFQWLRSKQLRKGDRLFIYLAGHGDAIDESQFFFLGYDCNPRGDKNNYLVAGAIQLFNLKLKIASETAKGVEVFFIMDACRSNELPGGVNGQQSLSNAITEKKAGEIIMLATSAGQSSLEDASIGNGNGLFTYYLINGLSGLADSTGNADHRISLAEIEAYVNNYVPAVAESKFKRRQQPFFCCDNMRDHIISRVDTVYLKNWLKTKLRKGPGNSFTEKWRPRYFLPDTTLQEIYNHFTLAVKEKRLTGTNSAESFYMQMENRIPGNVYARDARSILAAEFVDYAQERVDQFLDCGGLPGTENAGDYKEAASRLEKAIDLLKQDEPQFSATYLSRLYLLKSTESFDYAYKAFAIDPGAAFASNLLALLHKRNNNRDSAIYYANMAITAAPNWKCGFSTLASIYRSMGLKDSARKYENKPGSRPVRKYQFGGFAGAGISRPVINLSEWDQRNVNYNDSLFNLTGSNGARFEAGIFLQINTRSKFSIRPTVSVSLDDKTSLVYHKKSATGIPEFESISLKMSSFNISLPVVFRFTEKSVSPYLSAAPTVYFILSQDNTTAKLLPLNNTGINGNFGFGVDIRLSTGLTISPEFGFIHGFSNQVHNIDNLYTNTISTLKHQSFSFKLLFKK